ncbi:MAG: hypothetical protein M3R59_10945 [Verrucomicrobiota bacterium]|nr:hypothetical protein [Verrucomicrobiota bacterium]
MAVAAGKVPDYRFFSNQRRNAFRKAGEEGMRLPEEDLPVMRHRAGTRPTAEMVRRAEELKERGNRAANKLKLEPTLLAPRLTLEALAMDETRAATLLSPW